MAATANFLSPTIVKLYLLRDALPVGHATGFFLKKEDIWYLVSNWHVFSGRKPTTGQPTRADGGTPNKCKFIALDYEGGFLKGLPFDFALGDVYSDEGCTWFEHPEYGQDVDIGVLPLPGIVPGKAKDLLDPTGHDPNMWVDLGGELFLPGYPLGLSAPGTMPIWKRASLASSTEFGEGINKYVYVDTASREGMSGAPCLAISNWRHYSLDRSTGKMSVVDRPVSHRLMGVYSGRLNAADDLGAQLGLVWRENLIYETIAGKKLATVALRS